MIIDNQFSLMMQKYISNRKGKANVLIKIQKIHVVCVSKICIF